MCVYVVMINFSPLHIYIYMLEPFPTGRSISSTSQMFAVFISVRDRIRTLNDLSDAIDSPSTFPSTAVSYCEINTSQVMAASKILSHHSSLRGQTDTHLSGVESPKSAPMGGIFGCLLSRRNEQVNRTSAEPLCWY